MQHFRMQVGESHHCMLPFCKCYLSMIKLHVQQKKKIHFSICSELLVSYVQGKKSNVHFFYLHSERQTQSKEDSTQTCRLALGHTALLLIFVYFSGFSLKGKRVVCRWFCYTLYSNILLPPPLPPPQNGEFWRTLLISGNV